LLGLAPRVKEPVAEELCVLEALRVEDGVTAGLPVPVTVPETVGELELLPLGLWLPD
jgi:hypothetical protein